MQKERKKDTLDSNSFDTHENNKLAKCAELLLSPGQGSSSESIIIVAELRCGRTEQVFERYSATVEIDAGELVLTLKNAKIKQGSRFADFVKDPVEVRKFAVTETTTREHSLAIGTSGAVSPSPSIKAEGKLGSKSHQNKNIKSKLVEEECRVRAKGGNAWEITETSPQQPLSGTYLGSEALCVIEPGENNWEAAATFSVKKKDFKISSITNNRTGKIARLGVNKQKILNIISNNAIGAEGDRLILCDTSIRLKVDRDE